MAIKIKAVKCGKKCKKCPHHIYAYYCWRKNGKYHEKYLGKIESKNGSNPILVNKSLGTSKELNVPELIAYKAYLASASQ